MHFIITAGNIHDSKTAQYLLEPFIHENSSVLADRAFDTDAIIEYIASKMATAVIPPPYGLGGILKQQGKIKERHQ